jgi:hypothetical protein
VEREPDLSGVGFEIRGFAAGGSERMRQAAPVLIAGRLEAGEFVVLVARPGAAERFEFSYASVATLQLVERHGVQPFAARRAMLTRCRSAARRRSASSSEQFAASA